MTTRIRFSHKLLTSGQHAITSPDVKGFCVVASTRADAVRQAIDMIALIQREQGNDQHIAAVEYEAA